MLFSLERDAAAFGMAAAERDGEILFTAVADLPTVSALNDESLRREVPLLPVRASAADLPVGGAG